MSRRLGPNQHRGPFESGANVTYVVGPLRRFDVVQARLVNEGGGAVPQAVASPSQATRVTTRSTRTIMSGPRKDLFTNNSGGPTGATYRADKDDHPTGVSKKG